MQKNNLKKIKSIEKNIYCHLIFKKENHNFTNRKI